MIHIFIINSHAGNSKFSAGLRNYLAKKHSDMEYHIFHTRRVWDERRLILEILDLFGDEKLRIYCCGGMGTISNAIYGVNDFSNLEFAFYPKGYTNDLLKIFGSDESYFEDIDNLIDGTVTNIDYIKTNHGNCLNSFSTGFDTLFLKKMTQYRDATILGIGIPIFLGYCYATAFLKPEDLEIVVNDTEKIVGATSQVIFGNGGIIGGTIQFDDEADIFDGMGKIIVTKVLDRRNLIGMSASRNISRFEDVSKVRFLGYGNSLSIRRRDGAPLAVDFDGEIQLPQREWNVTLVKQGLPFVIPKGVETV